MQMMHVDSRGYAWYLVPGSQGWYKRAVDLPAGIGVVERLDSIEIFNEREPCAHSSW